MTNLKATCYKRLQEFDQYIKDVFEIKEEKATVETPSEPTGDSDSGEETEASVNTTKDYFNY